jgi:hypothetical protein
MSAFWDLEANQIESAERAVRDRKEAHLRKTGWDHTSATVDCCWRWFKTIDGRHYGCGTDDAFRIQKVIDSREYASAHPEEFED